MTRVKILLVGLLALSIAGLFGCAKMSANSGLKNVQGKIEQAKAYGAEKHTKQKLEKVAKSRETLQQTINDGDFKQASNLAKQVKLDAADLVDTALNRQADIVYKEAGKRWEDAQRNDAQSKNADLYAKVEKTFGKLEKANAKEKKKDIVKHADFIIDSVGAMLADLRSQAEGNLSQIYQDLQGLEQYNANIWAPNELAALKGEITKLENLFSLNDPTKNHQYLLGNRTATKVKQTAKDVRHLSDFRHAENLLSRLRQKEAEVLEEGAPEHAKMMLEKYQMEIKQAEAIIKESRPPESVLSGMSGEEG
jgi:hypothetical protein